MAAGGRNRGRISKARGQEHSIFNFNMGNGYVGHSNLYQGHAFANDNLPRRGDWMWCRKERAFLSKIHNPFSHIRPENVCSGCLSTWGSMHAITLCVHACISVYDRTSLQSRTLSLCLNHKKWIISYLKHLVRITENHDMTTFITAVVNKKICKAKCLCPPVFLLQIYWLII